MGLHPVAAAVFCHRQTLVCAFLRAKHLDPAPFIHQVLNSSGSNQWLMFTPAVLNQRQGTSDRLRVQSWRRMLPITPHPRQQRRQGAPVVMGGSATTQGIGQQGLKVTRECIGKHGAALDQPRVAKTGGRSRLGAIDEDHLAATLLQLERQAQAHNACTQYQHISGFVLHEN